MRQKPQSFSKTLYDLLDVLHYMDKKYPGIEDRVWELMCDHYDVRNHSVTNIYFSNKQDDPRLAADLKVIQEEFQFNDSTEFWVSW